MEEHSSVSNATLTLRDYLRVIFHYQWVVIISVVCASATVAAGLKMQTPLYVASVKMLVSSEKQTQAPYSRELGGYDRSEANITQSEIVKSAPVIERAVNALHLDKRPLDSEKAYASKLRQKMIDWEIESFNKQMSPLSLEQKQYVLYHRAIDQLQKALTVEPVRGTNLLQISVSDFDPVVAATLANVVSRSYVIFDLEQQLAESATKYGELHPTVTLLKGHVEQMTKTLSGEPLDNIEAIGPATVKIISQATIPMRPQGHSKKLIFIFAVFLSFILGVGLAFIFDYLDPTLRSPFDVHEVLKTPLLATIPYQSSKQHPLLAKNLYLPSYIEAYKELSCQIRFFISQKKMKAFLFASPDAGEGTTTIITNLAMCLVNDFKKRVLIIDANYHHADIHKNFNTLLSPGLAQVILGKIDLLKACHEVAPSLCVVTAGDPEIDLISELDSQKMADIIDEAKKAFDVVLVDCADLRHYRDAISIGQFTDAIVMVVAQGKSRRPAITASMAALLANKFNIVGTVLNFRTFPIPSYIYRRV